MPDRESDGGPSRLLAENWLALLQVDKLAASAQTVAETSQADSTGLGYRAGVYSND